MFVKDPCMDIVRGLADPLVLHSRACLRTDLKDAPHPVPWN